ncbi:phosphotransferase enzyme family protein [Aspergillus pseudoustus]|uniref:Phosphotransferase enzyme family protein n=1 Tax=Aspergillus pseudoustus TaxID=1810923 RepID=A0ABR4KW01_9EURO
MYHCLPYSRPLHFPLTIAVDTQHDLQALNRITSGRWLWNEKQQFAARYLPVNVPKLLKLAAAAMGASSVAEVVSLSEGQYNKVLQLTMDDGRQVIAKLPNPNAGRPYFTTASEVATMDFLRNVVKLPVPEIYAWSSRSSENPIGAEYILMEKQSGIPLDDVWATMHGKQKAQLVLQIVEFEKTLAATKLTKSGSLYYADDVPAAETGPLYIDEHGSEVRSTKFAIGPTNHRHFFDFGRGDLQFDRGPWSSITEYLAAVARKEIVTAKAGLHYPLMPEGLFRGPRQYQPTIEKKLSALQNYLKVAAHVVPDDTATHASVLWHGDLHLQNIFVDPEDHSKITGIIDWQSVSACPLFMHTRHPAFLEFDGPTPENLGRVSLPANYDSLDPAEQQKAKDLQQAQTLHNLYLARSLQVNPTVFHAIQNQATLRHQVSVIPSLTLLDYEPCLNNHLRDVQTAWGSIVGTNPDGSPRIPCPLDFSNEEVKLQEADEELWARGVTLMEEFIADAGGFKHWDGRVTEADYALSRKQLDEGVERFLGREVRSEEEREAWRRAMPFVD